MIQAEDSAFSPWAATSSMAFLVRHLEGPFPQPLKKDNSCLLNDLDFLQNKMSGQSNLLLLL